MKHQCINGWTPHSVFEAFNIHGLYLMYCWTIDTKEPPFTFGVMVDFLSHDTSESVARWLAANTEGDW